MKVSVPIDGETFNVSNQNIYYIEMGIFHDKLCYNENERSDMNLIPNLRDNIIPQHVLNNMYIQNQCTHFQIMIGQLDTPKDQVHVSLIVMGVGDYRVGGMTIDGKLKKLIKILSINENLFKVDLGLKVRVVRGDNEIGKDPYTNLE